MFILCISQSKDCKFHLIQQFIILNSLYILKKLLCIIRRFSLSMCSNRKNAQTCVFSEKIPIKIQQINYLSIKIIQISLLIQYIGQFYCSTTLRTIQNINITICN
ncbi:hypothetical protein IMG5_151390 [Ichthyophthirius multifiliis]|uniref:Uncharacterized protein n=1 Tax=Ichthyophthirius multifiliis TaxID=5932 RepID=G0QYP2_ICHMU|nr:hypothetical protein IMG5_151390 [Ichthyophthirius multifiliis]EGR29668.1 hypothetical protein IMG5_151390 [Ichthyophthirius multifiliis]|eukprot:XP_004030904.1 hypothetical protein IMG5_151390 [Ichthyophthirius multifiliis]